MPAQYNTIKNGQMDEFRRVAGLIYKKFRQHRSLTKQDYEGAVAQVAGVSSRFLGGYGVVPRKSTYDRCRATQLLCGLMA